MRNKFKEVLLDFGQGAYIFAWIFVVMFTYIWTLSLFNFSETVEELLIFAPLFIYAAYMMGGLRRLNRKSKTL